MSAVAIMENWKVSVSKEMAVAAQFDENWGFLKATEQETKVLLMHGFMRHQTETMISTAATI